LRNHRRRQVVYTSTHDTDTVVGWFASLRKRERAATGLDPREPHWGLIELAMESRAELAMIPVQDVLGLGSDARMNRPGEVEGNWSWRLERGQLTSDLAERLREATARGGRTVTTR
jgi:4-alpha-glucanotransferase